MAVSPLAFMDVGQAIAQATLVAYDEGLGTCCMSSPRLEQVGKLLNLPDTAVPGLPAGRRLLGGAVGGRRPDREATVRDDVLRGCSTGKPFTPDPAVDEELKREGMVMEPAPLAWREAELQYLMKGLGLEDRITSFPMPAAAPTAGPAGGNGKQG